MTILILRPGHNALYGSRSVGDHCDCSIEETMPGLWVGSAVESGGWWYDSSPEYGNAPLGLRWLMERRL